MARAAALFVSFLALAGSAHAQVFKCVDAGGKTVYSQSPCPAGSKSATIDKRGPAAAAPAAPAADKKSAAKSGPMSPAERAQEDRKLQQEKLAADKKAAEKAAQDGQLRENCSRAKEQAAAYEIGGRISRINGQGERYYLSDDEIEREKAKAQSAVAQNCK
jgi:hypothetical protein